MRLLKGSVYSGISANCVAVIRVQCLFETRRLVEDYFISNTFQCNARLRLAKNQTKAKQHPEDELLLFLFYKTYRKQILLFKWGHIINDNENEGENET